MPLERRQPPSDVMMTISGESDSAREWLMDKSGANTPLFAYLNGKHTPAFEARLGDIGYQIVALFDHEYIG